MADNTPRFGRRKVPGMLADWNALRSACRAEGTEAIQTALDRIEEHIDAAYQWTTERETAAERIAELELLLARNLVMDMGSGEEGADALGGIGQVIAMVTAYREANPLPEGELDDVF
ncbi:hypothetical protein [Neotabrizicola sp. VNH66]|uniref:hypothetical protein n=1 Tax=Neotabrizicola sp. VNH66 TaxID=3400918 RepID=UPI003C11ED31